MQFKQLLGLLMAPGLKEQQRAAQQEIQNYISTQPQQFVQDSVQLIITEYDGLGKQAAAILLKNARGSKSAFQYVDDSNVAEGIIVQLLQWLSERQVGFVASIAGEFISTRFLNNIPCNSAI